MSYSHAGLDAWTDRNSQNAGKDVFATPEEEPDDAFGTVPDTEPDDVKTAPTEFESIPIKTRAQVEQPAACDDLTIPADLSIPLRLRRQPEPKPEPRKDGKWADGYLSDDDIEFLKSGKFK